MQSCWGVLVEVKTELSLRTHESVWKTGGVAPLVLNIGPFTFDERAFGIHRIGGGVDSRNTWQESNLYSSLAQARGLVALFVLLSWGFIKKYFTLWAFSVEIAPCRPSGFRNFEVALRFLENLCTNVYEIMNWTCLKYTYYFMKMHSHFHEDTPTISWRYSHNFTKNTHNFMKIY